MNANGSHYNTPSSTASHHNGLSRSLPPISSMDSYRQQMAHSPPNDYHSMPPRHLPAPYSSMPGMSAMPRHDSMARPIYPGTTAYQMPPGRMAIPPSSDPNLMIAGRAHKTKEVKRRTKTGCMTCRKRRIKCDEGKPSCKNCQKSKRECLGYESLQQSSHNSQLPAPSSAPPSVSSSNNLTHPFPSQQPSSPSVSSQAASNYTDSSTLDQSDYLSRLQYRQSYAMDNNFNQPIDLGRHTIRRAKPQSIESLCTIGNHPRPALPPLPAEQTNNEALKSVYFSAFAPALDRILETRYYTQNGFNRLLENRDLLTQFLAYIQFIAQYTAQVDYQEALASQESRIVWSLLWLAHDSAEVWGIAPETEVGQLATALEALKALLTGDTYTNPNQIPILTTSATTSSSSGALSASTTFEKQMTRRRNEFWNSVANFVTHLRSPQTSVSSPNRSLDTASCEHHLESCRTRLDNLENRDLIYSVMLMQYLATREELGLNNGGDLPGSSVDDSFLAQPPQQEEYRRKRQEDWTTAYGFLNSEASGKAMNIVCACVARMGLRAWDGS